MLTVEDVARHWRFDPGTIRRHIRAGRLPAQRMHRSYRLSWEDVWGCEEGTFPRGPARQRYREPLIDKRLVASTLKVSVRTVERWIDAGMPTRRVFGAVRMNPNDVCDWLRMRFELAIEPSALVAA